MTTVEDIYPPAELLCPISQTLMLNPVVLTSGATFDRTSITRWFTSSGKPVCPLTRQTVDETSLTPNKEVAAAIHAWLEQHDSALISVEDQPLQVLRDTTRQKHHVHLSHKVRDGHFLLPAYRPSDAPPPRAANFDSDALRALVRCITLQQADHAGRMSALRSMLDVAITSSEGREALHEAEAVPALTHLLLVGTDDAEVDTKWYAAEVLSYLALQQTARDAVLYALLNSVPWLQRKLCRRDPESVVRSLVRRLSGDDQGMVQLVAWLLWLLSLRPQWRYA